MYIKPNLEMQSPQAIKQLLLTLVRIKAVGKECKRRKRKKKREKRMQHGKKRGRNNGPKQAAKKNEGATRKERGRNKENYHKNITK